MTLVTEHPDVPCYIDADLSQFDTSTVNMAINARDTMDGEGVLTIRVRKASCVPADREKVAVEGRFVAISVSDEGSGITPENVERIFEPFFTTKEVGKGTGLGLSQVFGFARQSGGDILVESTQGSGTTFTLFLPRSSRLEIDEEVIQLQERVDGHGLCILLVEDNPDVGTFAGQALSELGYGTIWAADGATALEELASDPERFDIVFSDVIMPGMSGVI